MRKIKDWDLFLTFYNYKIGFSVSNGVKNLSKRIGLNPFYKRRLIKDPLKWKGLLNKSLVPSDNDLFYVNGINTFEDQAKENANLVKRYFFKYTKLIHNPTFGNKKWGDVKNIATDLYEAANDYSWNVKKPFINPVTVAVYGVLVYSKYRAFKLNLVGSSQGSLLIHNAILAFIEDENNLAYFNNNVKVVYLANVVPNKKINYKCAVFSRADDVVSSFFSFDNSFKINNIKSTIIRLIKDFNMKYHNIDFYLPLKDRLSDSDYKEATELTYIKREHFNK